MYLDFLVKIPINSGKITYRKKEKQITFTTSTQGFIKKVRILQTLKEQQSANETQKILR